MTRFANLILASALVAFASTPAQAELLLEKLVVEFNDGRRVDDIEVSNEGSERMFVSIEPARILNPGASAERIVNPNPEELGLLASPSKMILEPGQRKLIRIVALTTAQEREEVFRVLVRPVSAPDEPEATGLRIMVGYDVLVLVRPENPLRRVEGHFEDGKLHVSNHGNTSIEILSGEQCAVKGSDDCVALPGKRLYAGQAHIFELENDQPVRFNVKYPDGVQQIEFKG
ncbi:fimbrial biogenesis chaperone [Sphingomicrobium astaxanthinifaciens]|uniref:fimbrial biogenesis chaperone n=1 Tax=Sphingomicrobium astaxanthinifaciens TaxID=1227949 RepID=UPI00223EF582|nr:fimbria/pilus periplasmic chaperone [Sphingomicrobium astaxanthinifaciens]